jgi:hypothetical protein
MSNTIDVSPLTTGEKVDNLIRRRESAKLELANTTKQLLEFGVKLGHQDTGEITCPASFAPYLAQFEGNGNLEFLWEATYKDGGSLLQWEGTVEHNYTDIDLERLKELRLVSLFDYPTTNTEKRIVITLFWDTGIITFYNGLIPQDIWAYCSQPRPSGKQLKLVLKKRLRRSVNTTLDPKSDLFPYYTSTDEFYLYNRWIFGWQVIGSKEKRVLVINPNGEVEIGE